MTTSNRRHFSRIAFHTPGHLVTGSGQDAIVVIDLSLKGALLRQVSHLQHVAVGSNCSLRFHLGEPGVLIRMQGTITHIDGPYIGLACHDIDLDSATHLRRLVELNLGDPELLERELGALVVEA